MLAAGNIFWASFKLDSMYLIGNYVISAAVIKLIA